MQVQERPTPAQIDNADDTQTQPKQHQSQQDFGSTKIPKRDESHTTNLGKINHDARDDEIEFERIPIAGECEEDYEDTSEDDETEEEEDEGR